MIYKEVEGNLLDMADDFDFIAHQCNLYHNFGSGIALQIKQRFPWAYEADLKTVYGDTRKLGTYGVAFNPLFEETDGLVGILNCYCQNGFRPRGEGYPPATSYEHMREVFNEINDNIPSSNLGLPMIGAGLAGGDWETIKKIILEEFKHCNITVVKYKP